MSFCREKFDAASGSGFEYSIGTSLREVSTKMQFARRSSGHRIPLRAEIYDYMMLCLFFRNSYMTVPAT